MTIEPYKGVELMEFGMTPQQIENQAGAPLARTNNYLGGLKLIFPGFNVEFDHDRMVEVTLTGSGQVSLYGVMIVNSLEGKRALLASSEERVRGNGSIILMDLGVAIPDIGDLPFPLTAFTYGRMDPILHEYEKI